ncbi:hypothetical protein ACWC5I_03555 [Kitasatospora sp. NPDC001574]
MLITVAPSGHRGGHQGDDSRQNDVCVQDDQVLAAVRGAQPGIGEAWQREGHGGRMVGLCSLKGGEQPGVRCTTDPAELVRWTAGPGRVTVFATYASLGLGHLEKAHQSGLESFSLAVVDEAE